VILVASPTGRSTSCADPQDGKPFAASRSARPAIRRAGPLERLGLIESLPAAERRIVQPHRNQDGSIGAPDSLSEVSARTMR